MKYSVEISPDKSLKILQKVFFESGVNYNFHEMIYLGNVIEAEY